MSVTETTSSPLVTVSRFRRFEAVVSAAMDRWGKVILRFALAVVFIWFGALKIIDASPAADLVKRTVYWLDPDAFYYVLGWWEVAIGVCLLVRPLLRLGLLLLFLQLPGTFLPLLILPEVCFRHAPFVLTTEGQYIVKNLVIIGAGLVLGGTVASKRLRRAAEDHRTAVPA